MLITRLTMEKESAKHQLVLPSMATPLTSPVRLETKEENIYKEVDNTENGPPWR